MPTHIEHTPPILSVSFRDGHSCPTGNGLDLFPGDVLDLGSLGASADLMVDALACCSPSGPLATLRYLDTPREAWAFEDLVKFRVLLRPRAMQYRGDDGSSASTAFLNHSYPMAAGGQSAVTRLSRMLADVNRQCRLLVIDPLTQFIPETDIEAARELLKQHAETAARVILFRCRQDPVRH